MTTWADIQRLASDLQRVQLSQSAKRLSEANCIEVVTKLIERSLISVVFTRDGHSYITNKHLSTEVQNECLAQNGRVSLTDISTVLNIDLNHIERIAHLLVYNDSTFKLFNGELFAATYVNTLQSELRSFLTENGCISLSALCVQWNLSQDILRSLFLDRLPSDFDGILDGDIIYTKDYLSSHRNILRAVLSAVTKPTAISLVQSRVGLPNNSFWCAYDKLQESGEVTGRLTCSRTSPHCSYVPMMHDYLVQTYAKNMLYQNNYLQLSVLKKLGLLDGKSISQNLFDNRQLGTLQIFPSILLVDALFEQCISLIRGELLKEGFCKIRDCIHHLSVPLEDADLNTLCDHFAAKDKDSIASNGYVISSGFLSQVIDRLTGRVEIMAQIEVDKTEKEKKTNIQLKKQDIDEDWNDSKKGNKRKGRSGAKSGKTKVRQIEESTPISVVTIEEWLCEDGFIPEEIISVVAEKIESQVVHLYRNRVTALAATLQSVTLQSQKRSLALLEKRARALYHSLCIFETALKSFPDPLSSDLQQFLLCTVGNELANAVLAFASGVDNAAQMKEKEREETIETLPYNVRFAVTDLFSALKSSDMNAFHSAVFNVSSPAARLFTMKQPDKVVRSEMINQYIEELKEQVSSQVEPPAVLLSSVLLLHSKLGRPTTASGKFVSQLVDQLKDSVQQDTFELLKECQNAVVYCIKKKNDEVGREMLIGNIEKLRNMLAD